MNPSPTKLPGILYTVAVLLLLACVPAGAVLGACGDVNGDAGPSPDLSDHARLVDYLMAGPALPSPVDANVDANRDITNNDAATLMAYLFMMGSIFCTAPEANTPFPQSADTLEFRQVAAPAGEGSWTVEVWLKAKDQYYGFALPFAFTCASSSLTLESITDLPIDGYSEIDNGQSKGLVMLNKVGAPFSSGEQQIASLNFDLGSTGQDNYIELALSDYEPSHITVISKWEPGMFGYTPVVVDDYVPVDPCDPTFTDIAAAAGVELTANEWFGFVSFADYNGDGYLDIFQQGSLLENQGNQTFTDVTAGSGLGATNYRSSTWADFNNDGNIDLAVGKGGATDEGKVYRNNGNGTFTDITVSALANDMSGYKVNWVDYDNDGWVDLFCAREDGGTPNGVLKLFRNNGNETFTNVTAGAGLDVNIGVTFSSFFDFDNDLYQDLYVSSFWNTSHIFQNNRDGTFTDRTADFGLGLTRTQGTSFGDYNRDGWMDFFVGAYVDTYSRLFRNDDGTGFTDRTVDATVVGPGVNIIRTTHMADFNNDARLDIFEKNEQPGDPNLLFMQSLADTTFTEVAAAAGVDDATSGSSSAVGDFDLDGDLDILTSADLGNPNRLYENNILPGCDRHWIGFKLEGVLSNRSAVGARVRIWTDADGWRMRDVCAGNGWTQDQFWPHFGLGSDILVDSVHIMWPSGAVGRLYDPAIDQYHYVVENPEDVGFEKVESDSAQVVNVVTADLDLDTYTDVAYVGQTSEGLFVAWGQAGDPPIGEVDSMLAFSNADLQVFHFSTDTLPDILAATDDKIYTLVNKGDRTFELDSADNTARFAKGVDSRAPEYGGFPDAAAGYLDGDGYPDLVVAPDKLFSGNGAGGFLGSSALGFTFESVDVADVDADGWDDLVLIAADSVASYTNSGSPGFTFSKTDAVYLGLENHDLASVITDVDIDADGVIDIVAAVAQSSGTNDTTIITVAVGLGGGLFALQDTMIIHGTAPQITLSDVDRDFSLDVIASNASQGLLNIRYNDGAGGFDEAEEHNIGVGSDLFFALASADLDRDGQPDFVSGSSAGDNMVLSLNTEPDEDVLVDELFVTGYDYIDVQVTNPGDFVISRWVTTVAGANYYRLYVDEDDLQDVRAYDYNLQYGRYDIVGVVRPVEDPPGDATWTMGIGINGSQQRQACQNYDWPGLSKYGAAGPSDTLRLYFDYDPVSLIFPEYGLATDYHLPTFLWPENESADAYAFQLDRYHDFSSGFLIADVSDLVDPEYTLTTPLALDSVYYWRVLTSYSGGVDYSDTTSAYALYMSTVCCQDRVGDANNSGDDEPTIGDITILIDHLFISYRPLHCYLEADVNQSGGPNPEPDDITIGDVIMLVDYLFITGQDNMNLPDCL